MSQKSKKVNKTYSGKEESTIKKQNTERMMQMQDQISKEEGKGRSRTRKKHK